MAVLKEVTRGHPSTTVNQQRLGDWEGDGTEGNRDRECILGLVGGGVSSDYTLIQEY